MTPLRVLLIVGTRPEAIKMAPVIRELSRRPEVFAPRVCATAQHRQMLDQVLRLFSIQPDIDLNLMRENQTLSRLTASAFDALDDVIGRERPDWVLVQGDTTTVLAAALVSYYHQIRVGHVEAGLRTRDKYQPFPEEINRRVAGAVADLHFAPTELARRNLLAEGVAPDTVHVTGNTVVDALLQVSALPYDFEDGPMAGVPRDRRWILVTAHRRENFGAPLKRICVALKRIAARHTQEVQILYPVHLNPNVREPVEAALGGVDNISLLPPLEYLPLVHALKACHFVLTDSGGIQEEAPALGKPVLVMREVTERPEGVEAGTARLVGTEEGIIEREAERLLADPEYYAAFARAGNPYGDGHAATRIADLLGGAQ